MHVNRRSVFLVGLIAILGVLGTGCWSEEGWGPGLGFNNGLEAQLSPVTVSGLKSHWSAPDHGALNGAPVAVDRGVAYQLGYPGSGFQVVPTLYAYEESTGVQLWATALAPPGLWFPLSISPAVGNQLLGGAGLVFIDLNSTTIGSTQGPPSEVLALNSATGSIVWQENFAEVGFFGSPNLAPLVGTASGGESPALLISTTGGNLTALDPQTGQTFWNASVGAIDTQPAVGDGLAYLGASGDQVYAVDLHNLGAVRWIANVDPTCSTCRLRAGPGVAGGDVVVGTYNSADQSGAWAALDGTTGFVIWRTHVAVGASESPALGSGRAFVVEGATVAALSLSNGAQVWSSAASTASTGPPSLANGVVYVPQGSQIRALSASDGQQLDAVTLLGGQYKNEVAISDGQVFASTDHKGLQVYGL